MHTFDDLIGIIAELRSDHGCPWDKEQTFESLKKFYEKNSYALLKDAKIRA